MTDKLSGRVVKMICYPEKNKDGIALDVTLLQKNLGMEGDFHADGGDRQISLLSQSAREWAQTQPEQGICFARYKENLSLDGIDMEQLSIGSRLKIGEAVLEISGRKKRCYPECPISSRGGSCRIFTDRVFAKVVRDGKVYINEPVEKEFF